MTKKHIAKWLLEQSDVPLKVVKPVATRLGISTNYVGAALFAGQIIYENQEAIVKYTDRGGVHVGEFLHARAAVRYGEDHPLTEHLRENTDALDEAFDGSEQEALNFAEFYRRLRVVDWNTPDAPGPYEVLSDVRDAMPEVKRPTASANGAMDHAKSAVDGAKGAMTGAKDAVSGAKESVPDVRDAIGDSSSASAEDAVEIPVTEDE